MAEDILRGNPELRPFVLSNVRLTGTRIGAGAYASVEEVAIPVDAAAKKIHEVFLDRTEIPDDEIEKTATEFVKECQLMSTLRHPHIVQFLGVCFLQGSRLPALVMERLLTSLHDLVAPDIQPPPGAPRPLSFFSMSLKCSVLHNVACGLTYLHERTPPVIHRDLSARNVLLNSGMVAKIADLGVARIVPRMGAAATMTRAPGASIYMPPEAVTPSASNREKSKYDASIDMFSFGVVTIFTIGETFPCDPLPHNYTDEKSGLLVARTELQRRSEYMANVNAQLRACGQLRGDHPLIRLIQQCLQNLPAKRPGIREVLHLLEESRAGIRDEDIERNKRELVQGLQNQPRIQVRVHTIIRCEFTSNISLVAQNLERVLQDLVAENADLQSRVQEVDELQQQLHSSEREKQTVRQQLQSSTEQLRRKQAELTRTEKTIRREQQQIQEMRQQVSLVCGV